MIAALLLMQAAMGPSADTATPRENVKLTWDAKEKLCGAEVHGSSTGDPRSETGQSALIAALPDASRWIHLLGTTDIPFGCLEGVVEALRKSGRPYRVGFTAEPPDSPSKP